MLDVVLIKQQEMYTEFLRIMEANGFEKSPAEQCAKIFTENSLDGIYSHGVNRFPRFIQYVKNKLIDVKATPTPISSTNGIEQWNGNLGPGPLNALFCAERAMEKAGEFGISCLAIANTNHWMRGGTYGWHAAKMGFIYIAWTNTIGNMPAWGAIDQRLGNNPLILAVPYKDEAIVLDMAMSQFSYGKIEDHLIKNEPLPIDGGFDSQGKLTKEPREILKTERVLPVGYWKGAGLSLLLDILAAILSGGLSTSDISKQKSEYGVSQVFVAIDIKKLNNFPAIDKTVDNIIRDYLGSIPGDKDSKIVYPGQRVLKIREENSEKGIPVSKNVWTNIISL